VCPELGILLECIAHIYIESDSVVKVFYSPTNAQVIVLKTILKFTLK
jgi:hypothetical protein